MAYQMDYFAGIESKVISNIGTKVNYPAIVIVRDEETSDTCRLAFVDQNNVLKYVRGENEKQIVNIDALPDVSEGRTDALYIVGEIVYLFNGTGYKPINNMDVEELETITEKVSALEEELATKVSAEEVDSKVEEKVNETVDAVIDEKVSASVEENEKIIALETSNTELNEKVSDVETTVGTLEEKITALESQVGEFETGVDTKVDAETVQTMINDALQVIEF